MTVDVLVLNKDYAEFLNKCLSSIFSQTHKDFRVVVVDDNSIDDSLSVINDYKIKYGDQIEVIEKKDNNPGISGARNVLLDHIKSEYCLFVSSDDFLLDHCIENQLKKLNEFEQSVRIQDEIGGIYGNFYWVDPEYAIIDIGTPPSYPNRESLSRECSRPHCVITFESSLFKSKVFDGLRFDLEIFHGEETFMGFVLSTKYYFVHNDEFVSCKTKHDRMLHIEWEKDPAKYISVLRSKIKAFQSISS